MAMTSTNTSLDGFHSGIAIELPQVNRTSSTQDHSTPTRSAGTASGPSLPLDSSSNTAPTPSLLEPSRTNDAPSETVAQPYPDVGTIKSLRGALILAITCGSQLMDDMFITSGNMALPSVQTAFTVPTASLQWLVSAYVLTFGGFLLLSGVLADRHGRKRVFCAGMANLTVWTLANGFAGSFVQLAVFRALQGIGAAMTIPSAIGIISNYFVAQERLLALTVFSAMGSLGFCLGLVLGGVLTSSLGWRYVFYLPASITGTLCVLGVMVLPADRRDEGEGEGSTRPKLDFVGAVLSTAALILLSFVLSSAGLLGWGKAFMIVLLVLSVAMICGFTWLESKVENPIMPLSLWKLRNFAPTWISAFCKTLLLNADFFRPRLTESQ
ncbi:Puromycin resistance protein pur8 [Lasiodiplodia theobromae]|uniref:Puromycin resistance protein pur8 n=1 Tax=Lasiodiplodia theobromae TaxID=45133 RepID=A0A5N5D1Q1_9PEZI|nr:Puromycin resistance protein pur8 [Lasiodiplodia theobromae]